MAFFKRKKEEVKAPATEKQAVPLRPAPKKAKAAPAAVASRSGAGARNAAAYKVLLHPLITEKSNLQSSFNQYAFVVSERANKTEIKKAIEEVYKVNPLEVRIVNMLGKAVRGGRKQKSRHKNWKKALVTLPAGSKIDIYESV